MGCEGSSSSAVELAPGPATVVAAVEGARLGARVHRTVRADGDREDRVAGQADIGPGPCAVGASPHAALAKPGVHRLVVARIDREALRRRSARARARRPTVAVLVEASNGVTGRCEEARAHDADRASRLQSTVERAARLGRPALLAQSVEHLHGKEGVDGSSPSEGSAQSHANRGSILGIDLTCATSRMRPAWDGIAQRHVRSHSSAPLRWAAVAGCGRPSSWRRRNPHCGGPAASAARSHPSTSLRAARTEQIALAQTPQRRKR